MRIKCPHCNGKGFSEINSALNLTCGWCMGQGELDLEIVPTEPQTDQEYIQTCNTEQLAEWIKGHMNCNFCPMRLKCEDMRDCMEHIKAWLKQPHTNKE